MNRLINIFVVTILLSLLNCGAPQEGGFCDDIDRNTVEAGLYDITSMKLELSIEPYPPRYYELNPTMFYSNDSVHFHILADQKVFAIRNAGWTIPSMIKSAHACTLEPPYTDEVIKDIIITSDSDFSATKLKGANLSDLFEVYDIQYGLSMPMPLSEFIATHQRSTLYLRLRLSENPSVSYEHRFTIRYIHQDDEEFVMTTPILKFQ